MSNEAINQTTTREDRPPDLDLTLEDLANVAGALRHWVGSLYLAGADAKGAQVAATADRVAALFTWGVQHRWEHWALAPYPPATAEHPCTGGVPPLAAMAKRAEAHLAEARAERKQAEAEWLEASAGR